MLKAERERKILSFLNKHAFLGTVEATELLNSSLATVRRDFSLMESKGEIVRVHGGAKLIEKKQKDEEFSFSEKLNRNILEKKKIGKKATSLVSPYDCIYLDAGTTTLQMIEFLPKHINLVTNSINIAHRAMKRNLNAILTGGKIKKTTDAMIGPITLNQIKQLHFECSFIGINGISPKFGYTTPDLEEATIKQLVLKQSDKAYFLADHSKIGEKFLVKVANYNSYPLITENSNLN